MYSVKSFVKVHALSSSDRIDFDDKMFQRLLCGYHPLDKGTANITSPTPLESLAGCLGEVCTRPCWEHQTQCSNSRHSGRCPYRVLLTTHGCLRHSIPLYLWWCCHRSHQQQKVYLRLLQFQSCCEVSTSRGLGTRCQSLGCRLQHYVIVYGHQNHLPSRKKK